MNSDEEISRGERAALLLNDPLLAEAFVRLAALYIEQWESASARDTEGREKLWLMVKVLGQIKGHLQTVMETGKLAARRRLDNQRQPKR